MLACDLANPAKSLYQVKYTDRGIRAHYLTAFKSCAQNLEEELVFIDHSWQTNYVTPLPNIALLTNRRKLLWG